MQKGDRIIAVSGESVTNGMQIFHKLMQKQLLLIVQKGDQAPQLTWKNQDKYFLQDTNWNGLVDIVSTIGTAYQINEKNGVQVLKPITPMTVQEFQGLEKTGRSKLSQMMTIPSESSTEYIFLGTALRDQAVQYNPTPMKAFRDVVYETWYTLSSLVKGSLSPKWLSGPVGIVKVIHDSWTLGFKEALYWMALISLNLGMINLFPIPALDGGHICFSIWEWITKRRISAKMMERLILPFVVLLIMFFVYITYQDITRIFFR